MRVGPQNPDIPPLVGMVRTIRDCCQRKEREMCRKLALTASQFACLLSMPAQTDALNVRQVAKTLRLSPSRTSRIVDSLVRRGLVDRGTTDSDRRRQMLTLTSGGLQKRLLAHQLLGECEELLLSRLSDHPLEELEETLEALIKAW